MGLIVGSGGLSVYEATPSVYIGSAISVAWWNAFSAYHPTMRPVWPVPGVSRRPAAEHTVANQNTAMLYSILQLLEAGLPQKYWKTLMTSLFSAVGLDITNKTMDPSSSIGVGNLVGRDILERYGSSDWNARVSAICCSCHVRQAIPGCSIPV